MKALAKSDQDVLLLMDQGLPDREICRQLKITYAELSDSVDRIRQRAAEEPTHAGLLYERSLRRRAEANYESLLGRFRALTEVVHQAVLVVDGRTGEIRDCNETACEMFGYTNEEMRSLSVEELVSEEFRGIHPAYRIGFLANARKRQMGYHPPIFGLRRDGTLVEMAVALTASTTDDDVMVLCSDKAQWDVKSSPNAEVSKS